MGNHPLVMPANQPLSLRELVVWTERQQTRIQAVAADLIDYLIVEVKERELGLSDDGVLVVAFVADQRAVFLVAWQIARLQCITCRVRRRVLSNQ